MPVSQSAPEFLFSDNFSTLSATFVKIIKKIFNTHVLNEIFVRNRFCNAMIAMFKSKVIINYYYYTITQRRCERSKTTIQYRNNYCPLFTSLD